jgi:predicted amidophosphoribosyltransferase
MKCDNCGSDMKKGAKVCPECGMTVKTSRRDAIAGAMTKVKDTDMDKV